MKFAGCTKSNFVAQQVPFLQGRIRAPSEREADMIFFSLGKRGKRFFQKGRIKHVENIRSLDACALDYCYGYVFSEDGLHIAFLPLEVSCLFSLESLL